MVCCPAGIEVTNVMFALRRIAVRQGIYPRRFSPQVLAREFIEMLKGTGRNNEFWLVLGLVLKAAPLKLLTSWQRGRMRPTLSCIPKSVGADLRRMLESLEATRGGEGKPTAPPAQLLSLGP